MKKKIKDCIPTLSALMKTNKGNLCQSCALIVTIDRQAIDKEHKGSRRDPIDGDVVDFYRARRK